VTNRVDPAILTTTDRLVIRPWRADEADRLYDLHRRHEIARWIGGWAMAGRAEAVALIDRYDAMLAADPNLGAWAIIEQPAAAPAGTILLKALPDGAGEIEIGWHLHPDSWGKGLATEAARALLTHGFAHGLDEIWAVTDPANERSIRVCQKIGMRLLGFTHRWYHEPSTMFWIGAGPAHKPSLDPDEPIRAGDFRYRGRP
jgi:RimJ/RimL family protein N-acetyltransferase